MNGYISFAILCLCYGTSYAVTSLFIGEINDAAFGLLRSFSAAIASTIYLFMKLKNPQYKKEALESLSSGRTNFFKSFFSGILFLGLPTALTIIAQKRIPSFVVIVAQPTIPFFSMIAAHFLTKDEKITITNFTTQMTAIIGAIFTLVPSLDMSSSGDSSFFSYILLLISIAMYGIGAVYIKVWLAEAEVTLSCVFSIYGAFLYSLISGLYRFGAFEVFGSIFTSKLDVILVSLAMGVVYNMLPTFLFMDCIRELGAVKAQLTNFGQIIIGVFVGALFLGEWRSFSQKDIAYVLSGLAFIVAAMVADLGGQVGKKIGNKCLLRNIAEIILTFGMMLLSFYSMVSYGDWCRVTVF